MLGLDSSEMLPGSQKGENMAEILKTHTRFRYLASRDHRNPLERVMIT